MKAKAINMGMRKQAKKKADDLTDFRLLLRKMLNNNQKFDESFYKSYYFLDGAAKTDKGEGNADDLFIKVWKPLSCNDELILGSFKG